MHVAMSAQATHFPRPPPPLTVIFFLGFLSGMLSNGESLMALSPMLPGVELRPVS